MEKIEIRKRKQRNTWVVMWVTRDSFIMPVASRPRSHLTGHAASSKLGRKEKNELEEREGALPLLSDRLLEREVARDG